MKRFFVGKETPHIAFNSLLPLQHGGSLVTGTATVSFNCIAAYSRQMGVAGLNCNHLFVSEFVEGDFSPLFIYFWWLQLFTHPGGKTKVPPGTERKGWFRLALDKRERIAFHLFHVYSATLRKPLGWGIAPWSAKRESNSRVRRGRPTFYHWTTRAFPPCVCREVRQEMGGR